MKNWRSSGRTSASWLAAQMSEEMRWLLVHADDGVIWGWRQPDGPWCYRVTATDITAKYPAIGRRCCASRRCNRRASSGPLVNCWCGGTAQASGAAASWTAELSPKARGKKQHLLWGTRVAGSDGLHGAARGTARSRACRAPSRVWSAAALALTVRHYVERVDQDQAAVSLSRLVWLGLVRDPERRLIMALKHTNPRPSAPRSRRAHLLGACAL